ncbi:MAG: prepilin-type N-terminal cleavage/methylation domain-containing protein [Planctomycetota bacterium]
MCRRGPTGTAETSCRPAFTLIEVLIVVVILGVLASIVIPQFADATGQSSKAVFAANLRHFAEAAQLHQFDTGEYPADGNSGQVPAGFEDYIDTAKWEAVTPIGGVWDAENQDEGGYASAIGVVFNGTGQTRDDLFMRDIDALLDDGDLATGVFRKIADDRYYFIVSP